MMKKLSVALAILSVFVFSAGGCAAPSDSKNSFVSPNAQVFSLPSTSKVMQSEDILKYSGLGKALDFTIAKNEFESLQLIVRPQNKVTNFNLTLSDLSGGSNVLSKDCFEVYAEHYVNIVKPSKLNSGRPLGYYPDALVPLASYIACGYDKIEANQNQGIWITLKTKSDTPAGTYTGNFSLRLNEETTVIPVTVKVWNFAVPEENNVKSAIGNPYQDELIGGQLNNTPEMYEKYTDFLLDHRINTNNVVSYQYTEAEKIQKYREYANDPRVNVYSFTQVGKDIVESERRLRLLIENSEPGINLLDKEFIYAWDEPYNKEEQASDYNKQLVDLLIRLASEYRDNGTLGQYGLTYEDIVSVEILMPYTIQNLNREIDGLRTYCLNTAFYNTEADRALYQTARDEAYAGAQNELGENNYATTWWYHAMNPVEPYPNLHIDNDLISSRVLGWMQYEYGIEGLLNWGAMTYIDTTTIGAYTGWSSADVYGVGNDVVKACNGDGYIVYPGAKFGIEGPIPSMRMMGITDSFEDNEYLRLFNKLAEQSRTKYGAPAVDGLLQPLYRMLYEGTIAYTDPQLVYSAREMLAKYIEILSSPIEGLVYVGDVNAAAETVGVDIFASAGTKLVTDRGTFEGTSAGEGVKIHIDASVSNSGRLVGKLVNGSSEILIDLFLSNAVKSVNECASAGDVAKWTVSKRVGNIEHIAVSLSETAGKTAMRADIGKCAQANDWELANYQPSLSLSKANMFGKDTVKDIDLISVEIYNAQDTTAMALFQLKSNNYTYQINSIKLMPGWNHVKLPNISKINWAHTLNVTSFNVAFPIDTERDRTFYIRNLYYVYQEGVK